MTLRLGVYKAIYYIDVHYVQSNKIQENIDLIYSILEKVSSRSEITPWNKIDKQLVFTDLRETL